MPPEMKIYQRPAELLQNLIRFDTTNPPGNEAACIAYINELFTKAGFQTNILAKDQNRTNLIARLKGQGNAPPLLLYGHIDVVTTAKQEWTYPPFEGKIIDGYIWGRGALDMKGGVAMMLAALMRAKAEGFTPAGDVVLTVVSDEETGGDYGAKFLAESHKEYFAGIRYAIGEFGAFTLYLGKKKFYPIQVAEKQTCWMKVTLRGAGGHSAFPVRDGALAKLGILLQKLKEHRLPVHVTPVVRQMINKMAAVLPLPMNSNLTKLLDPSLTDDVLEQLGLRG
jgi:acetylornithine deacetylase/succinyl-diaminopimelate desuccinylase-like protein